MIAQLGKNYADGIDAKISGDELIDIALEKIAMIQYDLSGKYAYIECEEAPKLVTYYERNDFCRLDNGSPEAIYDTTEHYLVQMLKYLS